MDYSWKLLDIYFTSNSQIQNGSRFTSPAWPNAWHFRFQPLISVRHCKMPPARNNANTTSSLCHHIYSTRTLNAMISLLYESPQRNNTRNTECHNRRRRRYRYVDRRSSEFYCSPSNRNVFECLFSVSKSERVPPSSALQNTCTPRLHYNGRYLNHFLKRHNCQLWLRCYRCRCRRPRFTVVVACSL